MKERIFKVPDPLTGRPMPETQTGEAITITKEVLEAFIFLTIRYGYKGAVIILPSNGQVLHGHEQLQKAADAGSTEVLAIEFDPDLPGLDELASHNRRSEGQSPIAERHYISPDDLERDPEHAAHLPYTDEEEFDDTDGSYRQYGKLQPVYYFEYIRNGRRVRSVCDGWKYVKFARKNNIKEIFACRLNIGNNHDLVTIMFQLHRSNHSDMMAWYRMCEALWPKYFRGPGYRSDMKDDELANIRSEHNGKRKNIYEKIGGDLSMSANTVKFLLKVGRVNPLHFGRIEKSRFTLYHAYLECVAEEKGVLPSIPAPKEARIIKDMTQPPVFSESTTTGPVVFTSSTTTNDTYTQETDQAHCDHNAGDHKVSAQAVIIADDEKELILEVTCPYCNRKFSITAKK